MSLGRMMLIVSLLCVALAILMRPVSWVHEQIDWASFFDGLLCFYRPPLWCIGVDPGWLSDRRIEGNGSMVIGTFVGLWPAIVAYAGAWMVTCGAVSGLWKKTELD